MYIPSQVNVHFGTCVKGIQVSVFSFTVSLFKHTYFKWLAIILFKHSYFKWSVKVMV